MAKNDLAPSAPEAQDEGSPVRDLKELGSLALNQELTERLGTEVRSFDARWSTYAQEGVLVQVHLTRERFKLQLTLRDLGIEPRDKKEADQLNSILAPGHRFLLPREIAVKRPERIESDSREALKRYSWKTYWGRWIHVRTFPKWIEVNAEIQARYLALVDEIEANYDQLRQEALIAWIGLSNRAYDQLARTDAAGRIPGFADRDAWIDQQRDSFLAKVPTMETIRSKFKYSFDVYSLPSLVQQVQDEDREARWRRMSDAERAMQVALEETAKRRVQEGVDRFVSEIQGQIQAEVLAVSSAALKVVQGRGGKLERNSSKALKDLIEQWRTMVFWDDDTSISTKLNELERVLEVDPKKRDPQVTTSVLRALSAEARLALGNIDLPPERTAVDTLVADAFEKANEAGISDDPEALEVIAGRVSIDDVDDDDLYEEEDDAPVATRLASDPNDLSFDLDDEEDEAQLNRQPIAAG